MRNLESRIAKLEAETNSRRIPLFVFGHPGEAELQRRIIEKATSEGVLPRNVAILLWGKPT